MTATKAAYEEALKEVFTQDRLESQVVTGTLLLDKIEKTSKFMVGRHAVVPLHTERGGAYTALPDTGGAFNAASAQGVKRVTYTQKHHYLPIEIDEVALEETEGNSVAAAAALETEVSGALDDVRRHYQRQILQDGNALIARCTTTTTSNEVELDPDGDGYDAIVRGFLHVGAQVVIGTTANETAIATVRTITDVEEDPDTPSITIDGATVSTTSSHYVSWSKSRSGAVSREMNGLGQLISNTAVFGKDYDGNDMDPATYPFWKPAGADTTTTSISIEKMMWLGRKVYQKTGKMPDLTVMGLEQKDEFYAQLQQQINYSGDSISVGDRTGIKWNGQNIFDEPDMRVRDVYALSTKHLFLVGRNKPQWQNAITGGDILEWKQGYPAFVATLLDHRELACNRRNAFAGLRALERPAE